MRHAIKKRIVKVGNFQQHQDGNCRGEIAESRRGHRAVQGRQVEPRQQEVIAIIAGDAYAALAALRAIWLALASVDDDPSGPAELRNQLRHIRRLAGQVLRTGEGEET